MDSGDVHKVEYEQLMAESRLHNTTASAIVSLEVAALGVGIPIAIKSQPYVLAALAGLTLILWLRYLDHVAGIYRVAAYVALVLRPKFADLTGDKSVFGWESFFRRLRRGDQIDGVEGVTGRDALGEKILGLGYTSGLFGLTPPVMLAAFWAQQRTHNITENLAVICVCVAGTSLWIFCLARFRYGSLWISGINKMIDETGHPSQ
jgi:hypothetical protein